MTFHFSESLRSSSWTAGNASIRLPSLLTCFITSFSIMWFSSPLRGVRSMASPYHEHPNQFAAPFATTVMVAKVPGIDDVLVVVVPELAQEPAEHQSSSAVNRKIGRASCRERV